MNEHKNQNEIVVVQARLDETPLLSAMACEIWNQHFPPLVGQTLVDYLLDKIQSSEAMAHQIREENIVYYFLTFNGEKVGYMAVRVEGDVLFLSKFYIKKEFRGKGIARAGMNYFEDFCRQRQLKKIYLHVNRKNLGVIKIYEKLGLKNVGAEVTEMGHGFVMDDYVMEKVIS